MNEEHLRICASPEWARYVADELLPWVLAGFELARRLSGTNVLVLRGDGTRLPFQPARFSAVTMLTMLHHVPSAALQDRLLAEARRVLRAGGVIAGTDGLDTPRRREVHEGDVFVPVDPAALPGRLTAAGFADPVVEVAGDRIRFAARAPS